MGTHQPKSSTTQHSPSCSVDNNHKRWLPKPSGSERRRRFCLRSQDLHIYTGKSLNFDKSLIVEVFSFLIKTGWSRHMPRRRVEFFSDFLRLFNNLFQILVVHSLLEETIKSESCLGGYENRCKILWIELNQFYFRFCLAEEAFQMVRIEFLSADKINWCSFPFRFRSCRQFQNLDFK